MSKKWISVPEKYNEAIIANLNRIRSELDRLYWNENQAEMTSPFDNTGAPDFSTNYFTVRSYNWDENTAPNFECANLRVYWYKHSNRGISAQIQSAENIAEQLVNILNDSLTSLRIKFGEM